MVAEHQLVPVIQKDISGEELGCPLEGSRRLSTEAKQCPDRRCFRLARERYVGNRPGQKCWGRATDPISHFFGTGGGISRRTGASARPGSLRFSTVPLRKGGPYRPRAIQSSPCGNSSSACYSRERLAAHARPNSIKHRGHG